MLLFVGVIDYIRMIITNIKAGFHLSFSFAFKGLNFNKKYDIMNKNKRNKEWVYLTGFLKERKKLKI